MNEKWLKGDQFQNRYRIAGTLTTVSPLHIGTGNESAGRVSDAEKKRHEEKREKVPSVSLVAKDVHGKPIIPGSALKGVLRHWLLNVLATVPGNWAILDEDEKLDMDELSQEKQIEKIKSQLSWLSLVFGSRYHEGKLEAWDAVCTTKNLTPLNDKLLSWDSKSLTYVDTSVAIDPATGTAAEHLLYKSEIVPPGVDFELTLVGQNLNDLELGLVLLALQGFNSAIYPVRLGARGGRGFGRMSFSPGAVYGLRNVDELKAWVKQTLDAYDATPVKSDKSSGTDAAGYFALPQLSADQQADLIRQAKQALTKSLGG